MAESSSPDIYAGFNDHNAALETDGIEEDADIAAAIKTSYGNRPIKTGQKRLATGIRMGTAVRTGTAVVGADGEAVMKRPMTAINTAGFKPAARATSAEGPAAVAPSGAVLEAKPERKDDVMRKLERKVHQHLEDSAMLASKKEYAKSIDAAKMAVQIERQLTKLREDENPDVMNWDLTYAVQVNLASIHHRAGMFSEALHQYQAIVKNRVFEKVGRLRVNMGNIYSAQKKYLQAIKMYRMALDQIPYANQRMRNKVLRNIGHAFVAIGQYAEAAQSYELVLDQRPTKMLEGGVERKVAGRDFATAFNVVLCVFALGDRNRMQSAFLALLQQEVSSPPDDARYTNLHNDEDVQIVLDVIKTDTLFKAEQRERLAADKFIVTAAKLIAPCIEDTFEAGCNWCIENVRMSKHADLAAELEITKAVTFLKLKEFSKAVKTLEAFEKSDSRMQSAAATNLSFLYFRKMQYSQADKYADVAVSADKYNPSALVNKGNCEFVNDEIDKAMELYSEALTIDSGCTEALYNLGLCHKKQDDASSALQCFLDLYQILPNSADVIYQVAHMYEILDDVDQACDWFIKLISIAPTDTSILAHLGALFDMDNDKSQAFQYHWEAFKYFPSDISIVEWLGAYYVDSQYPAKAIQYFERAALVQPTEEKWQLMVASCHRRCGDYQIALETYKMIHQRFPENIECLKFLVRLCTDLGLKETDTYTQLLRKAEKAKELREHRSEQKGRTRRRKPRSGRISSGSTDGSASLDSATRSRRRGIQSAESDAPAPPHALQEQATAPSPPEMLPQLGGAATYSDPMGNIPERPRTAAVRATQEDEWDDHELGDDMLPE
eukprot:m.538349 g.538349  ORF g.538349 m.538349 type:complete len:837 (-) comp22083_c0_seq4:1197-3707(-)